MRREGGVTLMGLVLVAEEIPFIHFDFAELFNLLLSVQLRSEFVPSLR